MCTQRLARLGSFFLMMAVALLPASGQGYVFRVYRQAEGLKNLGINSMSRDTSGFLWLATENGLYRFLGQGFDRFGREQGIREPDVVDVLADANGVVWAATGENLYRSAGTGFVPVGREPIPIVGPRRMTVVDQHTMLVIAHGQLYRLEHDAQGHLQRFEQVFSAEQQSRQPELQQLRSVFALKHASTTEIWMGCGDGLCSLRADALQQRPEKPIDLHVWKSAQGIKADRWEAALYGRDGTLWAVSYAHIAALPAAAARFEEHDIPDAAANSTYGHAPLIEDREGRILVAADNGLARWENGHWKHIDKFNNLEKITSISGISFDDAGDLWLASRGTGLQVWLGYGEWEGWSDEQGLPSSSIWDIFPTDARHVMVGTEYGPAMIDLNTGTVSRQRSKALWPWGMVTHLGRNADGTWWATTGLGYLLEFSRDLRQIKQTGKLPGYVMDAVTDHAGHTFFSTHYGLYLRQQGEERKQPTPIPAANALMGKQPYFETDCLARDGSVWFLGNNQLVHFDKGNWYHPALHGVDVHQGTLLTLHCPADGSVWLSGSQAGTWRLTGSNSLLQATELKLPDTFRSFSILSLLTDRRGWIWMGTDQGMLVTNGHEWRHITQESGLIWNDSNQNTLIEANDGSIFIGTSSGLGHLLHPERAFDTVPVRASITRIERAGVIYSPQGEIRMAAIGAPIVFQISSPTVRNRSELNIRLRLSPQHMQWLESEDGIARFGKLEPGQQTFLAQVCNPALGSCSALESVKLNLLPPWWKSKWFYMLCGVLLVALLIVVERLQARRLLLNSRRLEELVRERTRELELSRAQLRIQATHDGLTGMLNRTAILRSLVAEMDRARREDRALCVVLIDIDHFKRVNDTYGHLAGDDALRWFAAAVGAAIRPYDHAGRYGGEEFLLVLTELPLEAIEQRLAKLHAALSNLMVRTHGIEFQICSSMGATIFHPALEDQSSEALLALADQALYAAKSNGRNRVVFYANSQMAAAAEAGIDE